MTSKSKLIIGTLSSAFLVAINASIAVGKDLGEVCTSPNPTCDAILFTSNIIQPTYELDEGKAREKIEDLGWKKEETYFLDPKSFLKENGSLERVDAQAIISKQVVKGKTYYLISFRGTEPTKVNPDLGGNLLENIGGNDLATDSKITQTNFEGKSKVHTGFLTYTEAVYRDPKISRMIQEVLNDQSQGNPYEVLITGHSLGGAAAEVFSAILQERSKIPIEKLKTVVFGAPSAGDKSFTDAYLSNTIKAEIPLDIVPDSTKKVNNVVPEWLRNGEYNHDFGDRVLLPASEITTQKYENLLSLEQQRHEDIKRIEQRKKDLENNRDKLSPIWNRNERGKVDKEIETLDSKLFELKIQQLGSIKDRLLLRVEAHGEYASQINSIYNNVRETSKTPTTPSWSLVGYMQNNLSAITQGGSTHIGSAAYYIGRPRNSDSVDTSDSIRKQTFSGASNSSLQQKSEYTDGFILKPPVDVVLDWNQKVAQPLDLDSHLTGPAPALGQDTPVRFHVYWDEKGSLGSAPNVLLYRDTIPDTGINLDRAERSRLGPEQIRIGNPDPNQSGVYRFYVNNYSAIKNTSNGIAAGEYGLSNSGANVEVFNAGTSGISFDPNNPTYQGVGTSLGGKINIPTNGGPTLPPDPRLAGNVWYVFQLNQRTGILRRVDRFGTVDAPKNVPSIGEAPIVPTLVR
jgi:Lipase (class 3)